MRSSDRQTPSSAVGKYCSVRRSRVILGQPEGPLGGLKSLSHGLEPKRPEPVTIESFDAFVETKGDDARLSELVDGVIVMMSNPTEIH